MRRILMLALCLGVLIAGPALAQSKATIQKLNDKWAAAFNKGDAAAVAAMYAEDAYVLPPGGNMVKGRSAIESFWRQAAQRYGDARLTTVDVQPLGPRATREIGTLALETKAQPPQQIVGKYTVVWQNAASAATHDQVMGLGADGFDTVMRGIRRLIALRDTARPDLRVYITMVVTAQNMHEVANFVRLGNELGVAEIWIRSLLPQGSLIPGLNYHLLSPTLDPDFERHRAEAIDAIAVSRVPVQADPSAWSGEILPQALRDQIGRNPPPIIGREEARRDRQLRDRNEHLYHGENERFRGRRRNDSGAVVTLSESGIQFATPVPPFAYAFGLPISDRLGLLQDDETGLLDIDLSVQGGKVGVGLLDVAANVFLDRKFVDAGFDGRLCFELPVGRRCELIVENGESEAGPRRG